MSKHRVLLAICLWCGIFGLPGFAAEEVAFFENRIRPILVEHCYECHSTASTDLKGGLLLDFRDGLRKGGESGAAVVPGKPNESLLLEALRYESLEMPPGGKLPDRIIADFEKWIREGAVDPRDKPPSPAEAADSAWQAKLAARSNWWSLQAPTQVSPPKVADTTWPNEPLDQFILCQLEKADLAPAEPADAETLARRLAFVLTGLPPKPEQVDEFRQAYACNPGRAVEALVDRLLASPHFGERFARHWMDVVRYTDTYGYEWDNPAKGSWEYRDYLIRAFNNDIGFDHLMREQLAGDLIPQPRINQPDGLNESLIGPMFYHMGEHRHGSSLAFNGIHQEMINNKIDAFSKAFLATTVACARCHDHKLEAVSQRDYYALAAVFMIPRWTSRVADAPGQYDRQIAILKQLRQEIEAELKALWDPESDDFTPIESKMWAIKNSAALKDLPIESVGYPISRLLTGEGDVLNAWTELKTEWQTIREQRRAANTAFTALVDFTDPRLPAGWVMEGDGLTHGLVADATPLVALEGDAVVSRLLPRGFHTHALSPKLPGSLRMPPQHEVPGRFVSLELAGGEFAGYLRQDSNSFQNEAVTFLDQPAPRWASFADTALTTGVDKVAYEFCTSSLNPNFPPRTGLAKGLPNSDFGYDKRSWLSITGIVAHDQGGHPQNELEAFASLYEGESPGNVDQIWLRLDEWLTGAIQRWRRGRTQEGDQAILDWLLTNKLLPNAASPGSRLASLVAEYRRVEGTIGFPRTVNSMDERETTRAGYRLNVRGDVDVLGEPVDPDFLQVFADRNAVAQSKGSGRLELADFLVQPDHPLTARVYVNRVWQWIFGAGLVATPDDFGRLGEKPSHPELLDYLAGEFIREGWSTKRLVRRLVLSQTFRQSGRVSDAARELDPENRLLHHYPTRRLEAEAIRDSLLAVSGRLDPKLYGRPILPPRAVEDDKKRLFSGPVDGHGRRSLYIQMSIMDPPKFLVGFNLPDLKLPTGRRDVTNVPSQALMMLNDPFVHDMAHHWATRLLRDGGAAAEDRVRAMFLEALGRNPGEAELRRWLAALADFRSGPDADLLHDEAAWERLAHAFFNTKEFIYYR